MRSYADTTLAHVLPRRQQRSTRPKEIPIVKVRKFDCASWLTDVGRLSLLSSFGSPGGVQVWASFCLLALDDFLSRLDHVEKRSQHIARRNDASQLAAINDRQSANLVRQHQSSSLFNRRFRFDSNGGCLHRRVYFSRFEITPMLAKISLGQYSNNATLVDHRQATEPAGIHHFLGLQKHVAGSDGLGMPYHHMEHLHHSHLRSLNILRPIAKPSRSSRSERRHC